MGTVTTTYTFRNLAALAEHFEEKAKERREYQKAHSRTSHEGLRARGAAEAWEIAASMVRNTVVEGVEGEPNAGEVRDQVLG